MKIIIKTTNLDLTPSLNSYIEEKIGGLDKFLINSPSAEAFVEIARTTMHHKSGKVFKAEVNLKLNGVNFRAEKEETDIRVAIDQVKDELQQEIKKFKGKKETLYKKGARLAKEKIRQLFFNE